MEAVLDRYTVEVPQDDLKLFKSLIKKMGWAVHKQKKGLAEQSLAEIQAGKVFKATDVDDLFNQLEKWNTRLFIPVSLRNHTNYASAEDLMSPC